LVCCSEAAKLEPKTEDGGFSQQFGDETIQKWVLVYVSFPVWKINPLSRRREGLLHLAL
jgi:hypothetical protein